MTFPHLGTLALALAIVSAPTCLHAAPHGSGTLLVDVGNVRNARGKVHLDVCPQAMFLKEDCPFSSEVAARTGVTEVVIHGLPAGRYALQATHDENGNGRVDRNLFGIPREGIGFSRDAPLHLSGPKWDDAVIAFDGKVGRTTLRMRYFVGPSGPSSR